MVFSQTVYRSGEQELRWTYNIPTAEVSFCQLIAMPERTNEKAHLCLAFADRVRIS